MDNAQDIPKKPHLRKYSKFFSKITFKYAIPMFVSGYKKDLTEDDITEHLKQHDSKLLGDWLEKEWEKEVADRRHPSLFRVIFKMFAWEFFRLGIMMILVEMVFKVVQPVALYMLLKYYSAKSETSYTSAILYGALIICAATINIIFIHNYMIGIQELGMKLRVALCSVIYRKTLRLSKTALGGTTVGEVVNLISNDVSRCDRITFYIHSIWVIPLSVSLVLYILWTFFGLIAAYGVLFMALFIPFQLFLGRFASSLRLKTAVRTDERIRFMNEIIMGVQVIKMYTWEKPFAQLIAMARKLEVAHIRRITFIKGVLFTLVICVARCSIYLSIIFYVLQGNMLTAEYAFTISGFYNMLRQTVVMQFPFAVMDIAEFKITINRLKNFLLREEIGQKRSNSYSPTNDDEKKVSISLVNVSAEWSTSVTPNTTMTDININVADKQLVALIGPVGSGKTSILNIILQELPIKAGTLKVSGSISYAPQEPWLFAGTVKQNILFGEPMVESRYKQVVKICALKNDFLQFPYGDETIVGERGITLSGGQKARVNLARATYKNADIYLLDDPLSAVDTHVGKQLFERCIKSYLKNKCVILVTHQLQFLNKVDYIYLLENCRISKEGTYSNLLRTNEEFLDHLKEDEVEEVTDNASINKSESQVDFLDAPAVLKEQRSTGKIGSYVYLAYYKAGGKCLGIFVFILFIITQILVSGLDYYVSYWVNKEIMTNDETPIRKENEANYDYMRMYTIIMATLAFVSLLRSIAFSSFCMKASITLHNKMFTNIIYAPMTFFDVNSSGRILNRFSKDIGIIDEILPTIAIDTLQIILQVIGIVIVIGIVNHWLLIGTTLIVVIFNLLRIIYLKTSRNLKRLEGITRSPVFAHLTASMQGLTTIRAFSAEKTLEKEFDNYQNINTAVFDYCIICSRAFGFFLDCICVMYVAMVTFSFFVTKSKPLSGNVGLAISQAIILTGMFQWGVRQSTELETQMTSVERVVEYTKLETEKSPQEIIPPPTWPPEGNITFLSVSLKYQSTDSYVLKDINIQINSKEKIGIVGRTGAGKSSLVYALFQLTPTQGEIVIDKLNIAKIPLESLRSKISIIPQEPVLFSGTIRKNLDPFEEYSNGDLWNAINKVELQAEIDRLPLKLNNLVTESGSNFSVGQRQLLCLARAILRQNNILLMDEATANVDQHTDNLIQKTIRKLFVNCTVLTVAHRLNTVMDSDKVLVMSAGTVVEFDHPHLLLKNKSGPFYAMVQKTGSSMAKTLSEIAETSYKKKE